RARRDRGGRRRGSAQCAGDDRRRPRPGAGADRPDPAPRSRRRGGDPVSVLLVRPRADGGLAAHVDHEHALLAAAGVDVREAAVRIRDRPRPRADVRTVRALRREITEGSPVTVHAHGLRAGALCALALRGRPAERLVATLHNRTVGRAAVRLIGHMLLRLLARRADTVLVVSPDLAADARRAGARTVRHAIVPAPVPASATASASPVASSASDGTAAPRALDVLVIARLAPQKGLDDLLDAAAVLRDCPDAAGVRIRVAGDGPLEGHLARRITAEELPVVLLGRRED